MRISVQPKSPKANEMEPPHLLGPAGMTLGPHHKGLRKSPIKGPLSGGHRNNPISSARASKKQHKGSVPFKIWEEGVQCFLVERNRVVFENEAPSAHRMKSFFLFTLWAWAKVYSVDNLNSLVGFLSWMGYR